MRLIALAVLLALTLAAADTEAQPIPSRRIGFLNPASPVSMGPMHEAFREGLRELGWTEGQTVTIEYRWAYGDAQRVPALAAELVQLKVDVIVTTGTHPIRVVKETTSTIPVVFVVLVDPVASGLVTSFARPGGNLTGLASQFEDLITKQPQLLKEALPTVPRIALVRRAAVRERVEDGPAGALRGHPGPALTDLQLAARPADRARGEISSAGDLRVQGIRPGWRAHVVWTEHDPDVPECRGLCRPDPAWRKTR